jgi:DNA mismatch endonuclease (patch repair protein)
MAIGAVQQSRDTQCELEFRAALRAIGLKAYRLHHKIPLPRNGKKVQWTTPDVVFLDAQVAIFVDGCYFHSCPTHRRHAGENAYWRKKMANARTRDERHSRALSSLGWRVLRVWECDDPARGAAAVQAILDTAAPPGVYGIP